MPSSSFLFGRIPEGHAKKAQSLPQEQCCATRWIKKFSVTENGPRAPSFRGLVLPYIPWLLSFGLEDDLSSDTLNNQKSQGFFPGYNLLLSAAIYRRVELMRQLLQEGRTPQQTVDIVLNGDLRDYGANETENGRASVWMIFLNFFASEWYRCPESSQILEEFVQVDVDPDIQLVMHKKKTSSDVGSTKSDENEPENLSPFHCWDWSSYTTHPTWRRSISCCRKGHLGGTSWGQSLSLSPKILPLILRLRSINLSPKPSSRGAIMYTV
ncbi:hypothetical protein NUU61_006167 [Penicillium alfredii]|uniref:Uncharacterized protein n=1 Tax=Penicillium alfredii TaxID=1506179 RepID=A0A9W9F0D8_9EURO|nr:uncharacterized protein NUU61_006167 [Penicillium alfredii]KAJ5091297.1 hypothetical protein NUU61_006167 [Penicillium alfredii]